MHNLTQKVYHTFYCTQFGLFTVFLTCCILAFTVPKVTLALSLTCLVCLMTLKAAKVRLTLLSIASLVVSLTVFLAPILDPTFT